jgi:peptide/nickel transport system substrate-binding protein
MKVNDQPEHRTVHVWGFMSELMYFFPPEGVEKWGDYRDWRNGIGTGPYIMADFVPGSSASFVRNPNYWGKDPAGEGKGNQLPYLDGVKMLDIRDPSTLQAAVRTGKVDRLAGVLSEDWDNMVRTNPHLQAQLVLNSHVLNLWGRIDTPPFDDVRVRRALAMAVDREAIKEGYYNGEAEILSYPVPPWIPDIHIPVDELPESAKETFSGDTEKAKQLLVEAGYPNGFEAEVICKTVGNNMNMVDILSIIKEDWAKIGVTMKIEVKEATVWNSIKYARSHDQMMMITGSLGKRWQISHVMPFPYNVGIVDDPYLNERFSQLFEFETAASHESRIKLAKENIIHLLDQAYTITPPTPYVRTVWQPWLKNYHGEDYVGYHNQWSWVRWVWIDQDLKKEMTGK